MARAGQKQKTGKALLQTGAFIMYRQGYNATGIQEIVDAAGVPKGSFYNHFASKEAFALEAMDLLFAWSIQTYRRFLTDPGTPPLERIRRLFAHLSDALVHEHKCSLGCFIGNLAQEMGDVNEALRGRAERCFEQYKRALAGTLREAAEQGALARDRDADTLAEFIYNSWQGSLLRMKAAKSAAPLEIFQDVLASALLR